MSGVITTTRVGRVRGAREGGVSVFRQIPFAKPTDGSRRFRPPEPPEPWSGVRYCVDLGPQCPQSPAGDGSGNEEVISEDSLTLNVGPLRSMAGARSWSGSTADR
jgi:para-nitrobenzyl esterase